MCANLKSTAYKTINVAQNMFFTGAMSTASSIRYPIKTKLKPTRCTLTIKNTLIVD
jgi:hypothetical protein